MGSSSRLLELKLMNCKGLQAFNFFQKLSVYALVSLINDDSSKNNQQQQQQRTQTDTEGDKNPDWNYEMRFDLEDEDHIFLHVDLRSELALFGDKSLGEVRVLLKDLIIDCTGKEDEEELSSVSSNGITRFVSYEVRTSDNKPNGVLTFSFKVLNQRLPLSADNSATASASKKDDYGHIDGYTIVDHVNNSNLIHQRNHQNNQDSTNYFPPSSYMQSANENLQSPYGQSDQVGSAYYSTAESTPHQFHYPSIGEGNISYPRLERDQFPYLPPPPIHVPPQLHLLSRLPFPPTPFPYPPPHHHHHHHHHHHYAAQVEIYHPPSPWDVYGHSHNMSSNIYYNGDGTRRF